MQGERSSRACVFLWDVRGVRAFEKECLPCETGDKPWSDTEDGGLGTERLKKQLHDTGECGSWGRNHNQNNHQIIMIIINNNF